MVDLSAISTNLSQDPSGLWIANSQRDISYPEDGNQACFELEDSSFWFQHRNAVIAHLVKRFSPNDTFFDIGGGNGSVSFALQGQGLDVVLVEPGRSGVLNARQRGLNSAVHSTFEDAGFASESLPSAGIFDVLEHIESDDAFLDMLHIYLQPNGFLYVTVPAFQFLWSVEDEHAGHFGDTQPDRSTTFSTGPASAFATAVTSFRFSCRPFLRCALFQADWVFGGLLLSKPQKKSTQKAVGFRHRSSTNVSRSSSIASNTINVSPSEAVVSRSQRRSHRGE